MVRIKYWRLSKSVFRPILEFLVLGFRGLIVEICFVCCRSCIFLHIHTFVAVLVVSSLGQLMIHIEIYYGFLFRGCFIGLTIAFE